MNILSKKLICVLFCIIVLLLFCAAPLFSQVNTYLRSYKISWVADENAVTYVVEIGKDPAFRNEMFLFKSIETKDTHLIITLPIGTYYVRIAGKSEEGILGPWSLVAKQVVEAPDLNNVYENKDDLENLLYPEIEQSFTNFPKGEYYGKYEPYNYDKALLDVMELFGDVSPNLLINLFYYLSFVHYEHGDEYLALLYYREAEKINRTLYRGTYKIKTTGKITVVTLKIGGLKMKYTPSLEYKLDEFFVKVIENYQNTADNYFYKGDLRRAYEIYKLILVLDPYNEHVLKQIENLEPLFGDD